LPLTKLRLKLRGEVTALAASEQDLAKNLQNLMVSMIRVALPEQVRSGMRPSHKGVRYTLNIKPVIPISLTNLAPHFARSCRSSINTKRPVFLLKLQERTSSLARDNYIHFTEHKKPSTNMRTLR
jgi:hypothetical protein